MFPGPAIFSISFAVLGYEVLLMRLLSITQWHHFAYMIISIALLGFGASGTFVALTQDCLLKRFHGAFIANALLFALAVVFGFVLAERVPLNPLEILWDARQWIHLLELYLILFLPFFFAANCISLTFSSFKDQIHRIYLFDLLGAGTGAMGVVVLLFLFRPTTCLRILSVPGFFAAGCASFSRKTLKFYCLGIALLLCGLSLPFFWPEGWLALRVSEYKGLSDALRIPGARVVAERFSPLGWLSVVESPSIPFRHAPGMSLNCDTEPPVQLGIFTDGDGMSPITRFDGNFGPFSYLDCMTSALPYHLLKSPQVLVLGAGGGADVLMALSHGAKTVDAVELDANVVSLVREDFADFAGNLYGREDVHVHVAEARGFVASASRQYDLIQVSLLDSFNASATGGYALSESYLYTVEALEEYLQHVEPGGFLAITRWVKAPPRDSLKLFATAIAALERSSEKNPENRLALIRSWKTTTLLVKNGWLTTEDTAAMRAFCEARSFDLDYCPGLKASEANRFNVMEGGYLHEGALALLGKNRDDFIERYKFYIEPATDDRPYFFHFFKWEILPEVLSLKSSGGIALIEWTYPILVLTFLQALGVSILLILLPLGLQRRFKASRKGCGRTVLYFSLLGFSFLFIEIAFIQKFILFLHHPLYAASVVLCGFLIFAGLGSHFSGKLGALLEKSKHAQKEGLPISMAVAGIVIIALIYVAALPLIFSRCSGFPEGLRMTLSLGLIAPLAFFMGMPFPLGLTRIARAAPALIPWAWGINGCVSVLSAVLATLLAIHWGFNTVVVLALLLYILAACVYWKPLTRQAIRNGDRNAAESFLPQSGREGP
ncbi:SAM-dependent methyltransferase [Desulforhabdus amnigena]|jgi:SAM-dependent methyltransferase|uniref:SAM-dependent methyltransferase n=1 Tax=Desulforhabdus amnigena TaxID=40218 RepID=A0A9W6FUH4_9BACT|nr:SAM-dependent methyltransferase [Desulforhabdus amnigena]NLJ27600.1 SAM-dependent methyltransferase [Deltaproteobacteria bacterium]GLI35125.1 hypothetical protein DAMNIGENAA_25580 [Desulforhabdus amnigena]